MRRSIEIPLRSLVCIRVQQINVKTALNPLEKKEIIEPEGDGITLAYHTFRHCIWVRAQINNFPSFINLCNNPL
jgi:hypothetical protein